MTIERRGFLSFITGATASIFLPDTLIVEPAKFNTAAPVGLDLVNLETITVAVNREFERLMDFPPVFTTAGGYRLGDDGFIKHWKVFVGIPTGEVPDVYERYINPAALSLANACKKDKLKKLGVLPRPNIYDTAQVGAIRGVRQLYCIYCDNQGDCTACGRSIGPSELFRFDVLGAQA